MEETGRPRTESTFKSSSSGLDSGANAKGRCNNPARWTYFLDVTDQNVSLDNIPATWHQQGLRIRRRLWEHLALTAKSTIICEDLRPSAACKECRGAGNKLVTRRTSGTHEKKRTNRQRGNQERMSYQSTSYTSKDTARHSSLS